MEISVKQKLSTHIQMGLFDQYREKGVEVMTSNEDGEGKKVGKLSQLYLKGDVIRARVDLTQKLNNESREGFTFTNFYGTWFLTRPD